MLLPRRRRGGPARARCAGRSVGGGTGGHGRAGALPRLDPDARGRGRPVPVRGASRLCGESSSRRKSHPTGSSLPPAPPGRSRRPRERRLRAPSSSHLHRRCRRRRCRRCGGRGKSGSGHRLGLDADQRPDPGRRAARTCPDRQRRVARDLEPRQLSHVDLRDAPFGRREAGRYLHGGEGLAGKRRPRPGRHARQDAAAVRPGRGRDRPRSRRPQAEATGAFERRRLGRRDRRVRLRDRSSADEGRPAGHGLARYCR